MSVKFQDLRFECHFRQLAFFHDGSIKAKMRNESIDLLGFNAWAQQYGARLESETVDAKTQAERMLRVNPKYILRNYLAQIAIEYAQKGDYREVQKPLKALEIPFDELAEYELYAGLPPDWRQDLALSCSS